MFLKNSILWGGWDEDGIGWIEINPPVPSPFYAASAFFFQSKKVLGESLNTNKNIWYGHHLEYSMKKKRRTFFV